MFKIIIFLTMHNAIIEWTISESLGVFDENLDFNLHASHIYTILFYKLKALYKFK